MCAPVLDLSDFQASGPRNSTETLHGRPQVHLGHSGLHVGFRSGIVLSNLGTSSNFQKFHPDNLDTLTKP